MSALPLSDLPTRYTAMALTAPAAGRVEPMERPMLPLGGAVSAIAV